MIKLSKVRKVCKNRMKARSGQDPQERDTLLPCPACEGTGIFLKNIGGSYAGSGCPWCDSIGHTDAYMIKLYRQFENGGRVTL